MSVHIRFKIPLLLAALVMFGCGPKTPEPPTPPPLSGAMSPPAPPAPPGAAGQVLRGQVLLDQFMNTPGSSSPEQQRLKGEALIAIASAFGGKVKDDGVEAADEWLFQELNGMTPEQIIAKWQPKAPRF